ncbi:hypothetical protein TNCV_653201 [Trichonephila clavipes]|nr:hypothetical protein TNCV_653201 [Trichonephila clavipes]
MWTTPELALLSPNYHTTPTKGRFSSRQVYRASLPYTAVISGTGLELPEMPAMIRYPDHWAPAFLLETLVKLHSHVPYLSERVFITVVAE